MPDIGQLPKPPNPPAAPAAAAANGRPGPLPLLRVQRLQCRRRAPKLEVQRARAACSRAPPRVPAAAPAPAWPGPRSR
eukprot:scaffold495_cov243-Pinguiococcus_pyrenoidosus.AAC.43